MWGLFPTTSLLPDVRVSHYLRSRVRSAKGGLWFYSGSFARPGEISTALSLARQLYSPLSLMVKCDVTRAHENPPRNSEENTGRMTAAFELVTSSRRNHVDVNNDLSAVREDPHRSDLITRVITRFPLLCVKNTHALKTRKPVDTLPSRTVSSMPAIADEFVPFEGSNPRHIQTIAGKVDSTYFKYLHHAKKSILTS